MMLSFNATREVMYCQSCQLAARLGIEIMSLINLMLVLFQLEMSGYTIFTEPGAHISRNRIDLKCTDAPFDLKGIP